MKHLICLAWVVLSTLTLCAQTGAPYKFNYQAVPRKIDGSLFTSGQTLNTRFQVRIGEPTGSVVYAETQTLFVNQQGVISAVIGAGNAVAGLTNKLDQVAWGSADYYLDISIDIDANGLYEVNENFGTSQLLSVPYAMYAAEAGSIAGLPGTTNGPISDHWDLNGTVINNSPNSNSVAIGTTNNFSSKLYVSASGSDHGGNFFTPGTGNALHAYSNGAGMGISASSLNGTGAFFSSVNGDAMITGSGNVGIGNDNPPSKLSIKTNEWEVLKAESTGTEAILNIVSTKDAEIRLGRSGSAGSDYILGNNGTTRDFTINGPWGTEFAIKGNTGRVGINFDNPLATLHVLGTITASAKAFTIDHPLDPENKILRHFSIESPELKNLYDGNVVTDAKGKAIVQLPDYFEALNIDPRYQLTVVGAPAIAYISKKISNNQFEITTSLPKIEVSWEVKAIRNDAWAKNENDMRVEEDKPLEMRGKYLNPKAFNQPESKGVNAPKNIEKGCNISTHNP